MLVNRKKKDCSLDLQVYFRYVMQKKFNVHIQIHYINYILLVEATLVYDKFMVFECYYYSPGQHRGSKNNVPF